MAPFPMVNAEMVIKPMAKANRNAYNYNQQKNNQ